MFTEKEKQEIYNIINEVEAASRHDVVLIVNNETQEKIFKELLPGYKIICAYGHLENDDKVYMLPID